jgi:MFS family permease
VARFLADITPLKVSPQFRRLWWGLGLANIGTNLTVIAVGLEIFDMTGSTLAVGTLGLWAVVPLLVMGLYGGALADAHDRRTVALVASVIMWAATLGIVAQAYLDAGNVYVLYVLVALQSGASAVNSPARSAIIPRLVSKELLPAANALNMITHNLALMAGPVVGAVLVATIGYGPTYTVDAVTFTFALYALFRLPPIKPQASDGEPPSRGVAGWRSVAQGLKYLSTRRNVRMTFLVDLCAMVLALPRVVFPAVGALMIGGGKTTAGLLTSFIAVGSALASVFSGPLGRVHYQGRVVAWAVASWGLGVAAFGGVLLAVGSDKPGSVIWWALIAAGVALAFSGAADAVSAVFRGTILQSATPDDMRGRLQGVFIVVVTGGPRLGDMLMGADSELVGEGWAVLIGGLACMAAVGALMKWQPGFLRYDSRDPIA